jgi:hypothetical protein
MPQNCDMRQDGFLLPLRGTGAEDFFALKNPTASTGFEPANFGTKGQHATSRPSKLLADPLLLTINELAAMKLDTAFYLISS